MGNFLRGEINVQKIARNEKGLRIGESHVAAKYTDGEVAHVLRLHDEGMKYSAIAKIMEMPRNTVKSICTGRRRCQRAGGA